MLIDGFKNAHRKSSYLKVVVVDLRSPASTLPATHLPVVCKTLPSVSTNRYFAANLFIDLLAMAPITHDGSWVGGNGGGGRAGGQT